MWICFFPNLPFTSLKKKPEHENIVIILLTGDTQSTGLSRRKYPCALSFNPSPPRSDKDVTSVYNIHIQQTGYEDTPAAREEN